jgi:RNA polymerase sigma-70 factor (ECF subfamily)
VGTSVCATSDSATSIDERAAASRASILTKASFDVIYSTYVEFVWRSAQRLGVDESAADDVVQQVFLIAYQGLDAFKWRSTIRTWLFGILLRVVRDHWRVIRRKSPHLAHESVDPDILADGALNPDEALSRVEASRMIDTLLDSLEMDKRVVFVMVELEGMTAAEIGLATGLTPNVVYSRLRSARTAFERAAAAMRRRERRGHR